MMMSLNVVVRAARTAARSPVRPRNLVQKSNSNALRMRGSESLLVRRFASKKKSPPPSEGGSASATPAGKVTKEMVAHELKEIMKLIVGGTVAIVGLVVSSGYVIETTKQWNPMPAPGTLIEIQCDDDSEDKTVSIHVQKRGSGPFTVIFDGGVGETSFDWDKVMDQVSQFATVVSIDRPGLGFSTPGALPRTSTQVQNASSQHSIAKEYVQVLQKLNVLDQVILVGHGAGGYNMRQLAEELQNPANCANLTCEGLVLVDALQENLREELERVSPAVKESLETMDANGETVLMLSRFGIIRMINSIQRKKFVERYTAIALPYIEHFLPSPAHRQGALRENQGIPLTEERLRNALPARGFEFPCVVLSHGKPDMFDGMKANPSIDLNTIVALERKWQAAQQKLVDDVSVQPSVHIVVRDTGHNIQHEQPEEITRVVRALVNEAQDAGSGDGLKSL